MFISLKLQVRVTHLLLHCGQHSQQLFLAVLLVTWRHSFSENRPHAWLSTRTCTGHKAMRSCKTGSCSALCCRRFTPCFCTTRKSFLSATSDVLATSRRSRAQQGIPFGLAAGPGGSPLRQWMSFLGGAKRAVPKPAPPPRQVASTSRGSRGVGRGSPLQLLALSWGLVSSQRRAPFTAGACAPGARLGSASPACGQHLQDLTTDRRAIEHVLPYDKRGC